MPMCTFSLLANGWETDWPAGQNATLRDLLNDSEVGRTRSLWSVFCGERQYLQAHTDGEAWEMFRGNEIFFPKESKTFSSVGERRPSWVFVISRQAWQVQVKAVKACTKASLKSIRAGQRLSLKSVAASPNQTLCLSEQVLRHASNL